MGLHDRACSLGPHPAQAPDRGIGRLRQTIDRGGADGLRAGTALGLRKDRSAQLGQEGIDKQQALDPLTQRDRRFEHGKGAERMPQQHHVLGLCGDTGEDGLGVGLQARIRVVPGPGGHGEALQMRSVPAHAGAERVPLLRPAPGAGADLQVKRLRPAFSGVPAGCGALSGMGAGWVTLPALVPAPACSDGPEAMALTPVTSAFVQSSQFACLYVSHANGTRAKAWLGC